MIRARRSLAAFLLAAAAGAGARAEPLPEPAWRAVVFFDRLEQIGPLAAAGELEAVHLRDPARGGFAFVRVDAVGWARLVSLGHRVELDVAPFRRREIAGGTGTIAGFPCYRTVDAFLARGAGLATARPDLVQWLDIGDSWEKTAFAGGDDLRVLRLTRIAIPGPKPVLAILGGLHPREYASAELALRFAEELVARDGRDPDVTWLLDRLEMHVIVLANPDGRRRAETGLSWRKNADNLYCPDTADRGADLNRNFPFQWDCCGGGSSDPCSQLFRGPGAASEPETAAIETYLRQILPDVRPDDLVTPAPDDTAGLFLDLHGPGEQVLGVWGFTSTPPPNAAALSTLGRRLAFANDYFPFPGSLATVDGSSKDFAYGALGVPAFTLELGVDFFDACSYFDFHIAPENLTTLVTAGRLTLAPYRTAGGPEVVGAAGPSVAITAGTATVAVTGRADDTRTGNSNGVEPSQPIASAEACLDRLPDDPGAVCTALAAADGAFDEPVEELTGSVPTAALAPGRHRLFFRARDAAGDDGPPSAAFLTVLDPTDQARLAGLVRHADTHAPIPGARVELGLFSTPGSAGGAYQLDVPSGTYSLRATAPGFAPVTRTIELGAADSRSLELFLSPFRSRFADGAEGAPAWTAEPPWAVTTATAASGTRSWTDSPGGNYLAGTDASLVSPTVDLSDAIAVEIQFAHRFDLFPGFDLAQVEVSADGGASWTVVGVYTGENQTAWRTERIAVPTLAGQAQARFRFRLLTRSPVTRDGWYVDDVVLFAARAGSYLFADGFESGNVSRWTLASPVP